MDWLWLLVSVIVSLHIVGFLVWANYARQESSAARNRMQMMMRAVTNRSNKAEGKEV
jgi:cytochrome b subunit of formate dehydrogenase